MRSAFKAAEGSYNILCVSSVSSPIYRVFRKISGNTYTSNYSEVSLLFYLYWITGTDYHNLWGLSRFLAPPRLRGLGGGYIQVQVIRDFTGAGGFCQTTPV